MTPDWTSRTKPNPHKAKETDTVGEMAVVGAWGWGHGSVGPHGKGGPAELGVKEPRSRLVIKVGLADVHKRGHVQ